LKVTDVPSRGDIILTTLPVADLTRISGGGRAVFPQIALGSGFSTRLILLNPDTKSSTGTLSFFRQDGTSWTLPMGGQTEYQFTYQLGAGGERPYYPGNTSKVDSIQVIDRLTN